MKMKLFRIGKKTARFEFVDNRKFFVKIGTFESRIYTASSSVPAGSILGPTFLLIGVNDIADCVLHALVLLFADDIKLSMIIDSAEESRYLQTDINNVLEWSGRNRNTTETISSQY